MALHDFARRLTPLCLVAVLAATTLHAQDVAEATPKAATAEATATPTPEQEVVKAIEAYLDAFNAGDADKVAALWDPDGEYVTPTGDKVKGNEAIKAAFAQRFGQGTEPKIEVDVNSIRFVTPEVAMEDGIARLTEKGSVPSHSAYTAILVKRDGKWLLNAIRETTVRDPATEHYVRLRQLEWLIGDWVDSDEQTTVITKTTWTANRTFITRSFTVHVKGRESMKGTQVIGWDPVSQKIRSWVFDSQGGFGEGTWTRKGNAWTIKAKGVLPEGGIASATNVITYVDPDTFTWASKNRTVNGESIPDVAPVRIVRDIPEPSEQEKKVFE